MLCSTKTFGQYDMICEENVGVGGTPVVLQRLGKCPSFRALLATLII